MTPTRGAIASHPLRSSAIALVVLTAVSIVMVAVIESHRVSDLMGRQLWISILLIASFAKVAAIGYWFMDLRSSALWLKLLFMAWVAVFGVATISIATL